MKLVSFLTVAALSMPLASAHFKLLEPASWLEENNLGDPQKAGPCGGTSANAGTPSNAVTKVKGGQKLHVKVQETVYHPGHYRIALAGSHQDLPADPPTVTRDSDKGPQSVSAPIMSPAKAPVIVDGLFAHTAKVSDAFETDITVPNINCDKCTLQITQFMAEHGKNKDGDYTYHHCAELQITADPSKPLETWPLKK